MMTETELKRVIDLKGQIKYLSDLVNRWGTAPHVAKSFNICNRYNDRNLDRFKFEDDEDSRFHERYKDIFNEVNECALSHIKIKLHNLRKEYNSFISQ